MKAALAGGGVPAEYLDESTALIDDTMKDCILKLYRSAVNVGQEWAPGLDNIKAPVLLLWGKDDPYITFNFAENLRDRLGAKLVAWDCGHWAPLERPAEYAAELEAFWASV
jgi:pimeloyl-ACP methyl ester carboxylesterase